MTNFFYSSNFFAIELWHFVENTIILICSTHSFLQQKLENKQKRSLIAVFRRFSWLGHHDVTGI